MSSEGLADLEIPASGRAISMGARLLGLEELMGLEEWMGAVESYEKTLNSTTGPDSHEKKSDLHESLAFAYFNAAIRSTVNDQFRELLGRAVTNYERAARSYTDSPGHGSAGRSLRCVAMRAYLLSWLTSRASDRKKLLEEAWTVTKESLRALEEAGEGLEFGITFNRLSISAGFLFYLNWNIQDRKKIIEDAATMGEKATKLLLSAANPEELVRAYVKTAEFFGALGDEFQEIEDNMREKCDQKARGYLTKALEISEDNCYHELTYCFPPACWVILDWDLDQWIARCEAELEYRQKTGEKFAIGWMADWLTSFYVEKSRATDDPDARIRLSRRSLEFAQEARNQYSVVSAISPRAGAFWVDCPDPEFFWQTASWETDPGKRREMLEKASQASATMLQVAEESGMPERVSYAHNVYCRILTSSAKTETDLEKARSLLEMALEHGSKSLEIDEQIQPFSYRQRSLDLNYIADIESELGQQADELARCEGLLRKAITHKGAGLELLIRWVRWYERRVPYPELYALLGTGEYELGDLLIRLYVLTKNEEYLESSVGCFEKSIEFLRKRDLAARIAESYWALAKTRDLLGEYSSAADMFDQASENYRTAAQMIPQLKSLYLNHSTYMQAWSEIERARYHHEHEDFAEAANYYRIASNLHNSTDRWNSLGPIYLAWSQLEEAEDLSRLARGEEAIQVLRKASALFDESKQSLEREIRKTESRGEKLAITEGMLWSEIGSEFCKARRLFEEAKILDRKGDHRASSRRYGQAAETFEKILGNHDVKQGDIDLRFIAKVSRAWEKMTIAEYDASPQLYLAASSLFEDARQLSRNEKAGWLALGHSHFCKALESGISLVDKGSLELSGTIQSHFESAASYYARAGSKDALECAEAGKLLFEALTHMTLANKEEDIPKKAMLYSMAERVLLASADSFMRAGFTGKKEEVLRLVGKASIEKSVALSLTEILHAPSLISSRQSIATDLPGPNSPAGLEWFEQAYVHQNVAVRNMLSNTGPLVEVDIALVNAGRRSAKLARLEGLVSDDLELVTPPEEYPVSGNGLDLRGRVLHPLNTVSFKLVLKPRFQGFFNLHPVVSYLDEHGAAKSQPLGPVDILASPIVEFLARCFSTDYSTKRIPQDLAGWRSLMEVVSSMKIPRSRVYGDARYGHTFSKPLEMLIKSGLVESRIFLGERGRGGRVLKIRASYEKGAIRRLIDQIASRPVETASPTYPDRRLSAIVFTDVVGYTSLTQKNEPLAMEILEDHRRLLRPLFSIRNGREVKTVGDMFLVEFPSALEAVKCALDIQKTLSQRNTRCPADKKISVRIGVHVGDVEHKQGDLYGDAVNIASRIQPLADPGGILITRQVYEQIRNRPDIETRSLGKRELKNVDGSLELFSVLPLQPLSRRSLSTSSHKQA